MKPTSSPPPTKTRQTPPAYKRLRRFWERLRIEQIRARQYFADETPVPRLSQ